MVCKGKFRSADSCFKSNFVVVGEDKESNEENIISLSFAIWFLAEVKIPWILTRMLNNPKLRQDLYAL